MISELDDKDRGRRHALGSVCVLVVSATAFLLVTVVFPAATPSSLSPGLLIAVPVQRDVPRGFRESRLRDVPALVPARTTRGEVGCDDLARTEGVGLIGFVAVLLPPAAPAAANSTTSDWCRSS